MGDDRAAPRASERSGALARSAPPAPAPAAPAQPPLDRTALERVLARAAELQAGEVDTGELMTAEQLIEVGQEVGISPQHLRQALAEERTKVIVAPEPGVIPRLFGAGRVYASRTVPGTVESVLVALDKWMQEEECLGIKRRFPERIVWERRGGFWSAYKVGLNIGGRGYHLARAREVSATAIPVDGGQVVVRLDADVANLRSQRLASGGATVGGGIAAASVLIALGFAPLLALAPAVVALAGGYGLARRHLVLAARAQLALEQILDNLERGTDVTRPSLIDTAISVSRLLR